MLVSQDLEAKSIFAKNHDLTAAIFSEQLKKCMEERGLHLSDVAEFFDVDNQTISRWRQGVNLPSVEKVIGLSMLFGVSLDWLFGLSDYKEVR